MSTVHAPTSQIPTNTQQPHSTRKPTHHLTSNTPSNIQFPQPTRQPKHHPISQTFTNFPPLLSTPSPQMSTIHAPTSQIPTNIQSPHSTPSPPHLSNTHRPYDVVSGGDPHASSSSCDDSYPIAGSTDPTDRRIWIRPGPQLTFEPAVKPPRDITKIMKRLFQGTWATYGELMKKDTALADLWYNEFQRIYKWLPEHDQDIKKTYHHKASDGYQNTMYRVRRGMDKGEWIPALLREKLEQNWEDNKWKDKAAVNKRNRRSSNGPLHTCGSIPTIEHSKRLKTDSNMTPSCWEVYLKTHKMKGDPSKWVSSKSQMVADEYERRIFERNSQQTEGDDVSNDHQSDNFIFLDVVGGVDKKGRIYGLGI
ncbi:uncharacterized protein [Medicago truncatula]|uniref:uncharacterized protein isoform X2 n=1 Tax=Medicago truncatula TaxID=3880 RepID=UPI001966FC55|nr:uncharacterized protein LOC112418433 isoform X2 [Medicago truncatula]